MNIVITSAAAERAAMYSNRTYQALRKVVTMEIDHALA